MIKPATEKEWAVFGKKLWDSASKIFHDTPGVITVEIPFAVEDGFVAIAKFNESVHMVETKRTFEDGEAVTYFRTVRPKSDGTYHHTEWRR